MKKANPSYRVRRLTSRWRTGPWIIDPGLPTNAGMRDDFDIGSDSNHTTSRNATPSP